MKISSHSPSRTKTAVASIAAILLVVGAVVALEVSGVTDFYKSDAGTTGPTPEEKAEQKKTDSNAKQDFIESPDPSPAQDTTSSSSIELSAKQEDNGSVTILTKLYGVANGTCTLLITNGSQTYTESAPVIYQPSFSSCAGFNVQKSKLGTGQWSIKLSLDSNDSLEKTIMLGVK